MNTPDKSATYVVFVEGKSAGELRFKNKQWVWKLNGNRQGFEADVTWHQLEDVIAAKKWSDPSEVHFSRND